MADKRGDGSSAQGGSDGEDWRAVAEALNARMRQLRIGQQALSAASGVSVATLRQLQRGTSGRRAHDRTLAAVARALDWPDDHLLRVLVHEDSGAKAAVSVGSAMLWEVLRAIEAQLAAMNERLAAVEQAVGAGRR